MSRGPFLERPGNLTGPISYFEIKVSRRVTCVLTSNEVQFVSLRLVFSSDVVVVGVVIRSVEQYHVVKIKPTESEAEH